MRWLCLLLLVSSQACRIDSDFGGTGFMCSVDEPCPPGFNCQAGRCVDQLGADADPNAPDADPNAPDADPDAPDADPNAPDATPIADARIMADGNPNCDTVGTIFPPDDFADGVAAPNWNATTSGSATAVEASGVVTLSPEANAAGATSASYDSGSSLSLVGARLFVEVVAVTSPATAASTQVSYGFGGAYIQIEQSEGTITVESKNLVGGPSVLGSAPYNATAHAWWQLRESGDTVFGEVSSDGFTWTIIGSGPTPGFPMGPEATLSASSGASIANPGAAQFDNFNRCP